MNQSEPDIQGTCPNFKGRTAILGGTFNPVHVGHLRMAMEVGEALGLSCVELTPCDVPPHKSDKGLLPFKLREALLRAALDETNEADLGPKALRLHVSTIETELPPPSYTANLLRVWAERHKTAPLFILGDEDFACINTWREGLLLPSAADFVVVARSGTGSLRFEETIQHFWPHTTPAPCHPNRLHVSLSPGRSCVFIPLPRLDISASRVRELWISGRNARYLVPDAVLRLMQVHAAELHRSWDT